MAVVRQTSESAKRSGRLSLRQSARGGVIPFAPVGSVGRVSDDRSERQEPRLTNAAVDADRWLVCRQRRTIDRRLNGQLRWAEKSIALTGEALP
jgi:hypothetical protein